MKKIILIIFLFICLLTISSCVDRIDILYHRDLYIRAMVKREAVAVDFYDLVHPKELARESEKESIDKLKTLQQRLPTIINYITLFALVCLITWVFVKRFNIGNK